MYIERLDESVSLPLQLAPHQRTELLPPDEVTQEAKRAKLWHLIGWRDDVSMKGGFFRKNEVVALDLVSVKALSIAFMRPAKGAGFVSLEATYQDGPPTVLLQTERFNDEAIIWLLRMKDRIEALFGKKAEVNDYGSDY